MTPEEKAATTAALEAVQIGLRRAQLERDAAEKRFVAMRAENDDLQEEVAYLTKQLTAARQVAEERKKGFWARLFS